MLWLAAVGVADIHVEQGGGWALVVLASPRLARRHLRAGLPRRHSKDDEVARYTEAADQERLAERAITRLAEWEMSNLDRGLDTKSA